ncbi:hypothetical protein VCHA53O466_140033 [Vibrio chagasii]|nr:hypothetical protein VCHA53O466_140033 [Vibrio chagasii]
MNLQKLNNLELDLLLATLQEPKDILNASTPKRSYGHSQYLVDIDATTMRWEDCEKVTLNPTNIIIDYDISIINDGKGKVGAVIGNEEQVWLPKEQYGRAATICLINHLTNLK